MQPKNRIIEQLKVEILDNHNFSLLKLIKYILLNINKRFSFYLRLYFWAKEKNKFLKIFIYNKLVKNYGCFIGINSQIGIGVQFPHPNGIIIGDGTEIGKNCVIYQQVTIGGKNIGDAKKRNYPTIGNDVIIFSGAKIIGNIKIGNNVVIGANSVVNKDVEASTIVGGIPAKFIKKNFEIN